MGKPHAESFPMKIPFFSVVLIGGIEVDMVPYPANKYSSSIKGHPIAFRHCLRLNCEELFSSFLRN